MVKRKIIIVASGGTGSSLLSRTLNFCGMELGNGNTYWHERFDFLAQNAVIQALYRGFITDSKDFSHPDSFIEEKINGVPGNSYEEKLRTVLKSYLEEAEKKDWECFGFKLTTFYRPFLLVDRFLDLVESIWGEDILYFTTARHPVERIYRIKTKNPAMWEEVGGFEGVLDGVKESVDYWYKYVTLKNPVIVSYPADWTTGKIKTLVQLIYLNWGEKASQLFEQRLGTQVDTETRLKFEEEHSELMRAFRRGLR